MSSAKDRTLAVALGLVGGFWIFVAVAKTAGPLASLELASSVLPATVPAKQALAAMIGVEMALGAAMCLRAIRGFVPSLGLFAVLSGVLLVARSKSESSLGPCGCFGELFGASVEQMLVFDGVLIALHVALILWGRAKAAT